MAFAVLLAACALVAVLAVRSGTSAHDSGSPESARALLESARSDRTPVVLYRSLDDGRVAVAPLEPSPGRARRTSLTCDRVSFVNGSGLCLARGEGSASRASTFGPDLKLRQGIDVEGTPSRAQVSPDGRYGAVTLFVTGHSYADNGRFSTQTTLIDLRTGARLGDLEDFTVFRGGRQVTAVDRNFWGVTFAGDSDRFYATMTTGGKTYLVRGSVSERTAETVHQNVECPSLSPDGTRIAYKRATGSSTSPWRLTVLDLKTMRETPLAETRSVDDQAQWLDDDRVLYGLDGQVYVAKADGTGIPLRFLASASSPAVTRW